MRREVAIRWTNRKRDGAEMGHVPLRLTNAQNSRMLQTMIAMSKDVSGSRDQSQINPLFKPNILRDEPFL